MRQQQRALRRTNRDLERDRSALERQEKQLVRHCGVAGSLVLNDIMCMMDDIIIEEALMLNDIICMMDDISTSCHEEAHALMLSDMMADITNRRGHSLCAQ